MPKQNKKSQFVGYYDLHGFKMNQVQPIVVNLFNQSLTSHYSKNDLIMTFNVGKGLHSTNFDKNGNTPLRQAFYKLKNTHKELQIKPVGEDKIQVKLNRKKLN